MTAVTPVNHAQLPGILLHDDVATGRDGRACLRPLGSCAAGGASSLPDCDLPVRPTIPPDDPAWASTFSLTARDPGSTARSTATRRRRRPPALRHLALDAI